MTLFLAILLTASLLTADLVSPGHAAVVTHPAVLLLVVTAAGLTGEHVAVQTLAFAVDQKLEGLKAADAQ